MGVTISHSKPDIFDECEKEFGISWENTIFAVDNHIHTKYTVGYDVIEHELVHIKQQRDIGGQEIWWDIYFKHPPQRLDWELEAYRHQYQFLKKKNTLNKDQLFKVVSFWARNLSSKVYGNLIGLNEAIKEITK